MRSGDFLFVDDARSTFRSTQDKGQHRRKIQRHVQVYCLKSRTSAFSKRFAGNSVSINPVARRHNPAPGARRNGCRAHRKPPPRRKDPPSSPSYQLGCPDDALSGLLPLRSPPTPFEQPSDLAIKLVVQIRSDFQKSSSNPLGTWSIALDDHVHEYLRYYLSVAHERLLCAAGVVESKRKDVPLLVSASAMIQGCLEDDILLYALLANMSTMLPEVELTSSLPCSTYCCYQAIKSLRRCISNFPGPDESVIVSLWHLINAEINRCDIEAALTHLKGAIAVFEHLQLSGKPPNPQYIALLQACSSLLRQGALPPSTVVVRSAKTSTERVPEPKSGPTTITVCEAKSSLHLMAP